jgi:hypothetical protein
MVTSRNGLAKGGKICLMGDGRRGHGKLGDRVQGGHAFACTMKFPLQIELYHFHIAQSHMDVFVSEQSHEHGQADAEPEHLAGKEAYSIASPVSSGYSAKHF